MNSERLRVRFFPHVVAVALTVISLAGCGPKAGVRPPVTDGSVAETATPDAGGSDVGLFAPRRIYAGSPVMIMGITEDDFVVFQDYSVDVDSANRSPVLRVLAATGGEPITLGKNAHLLPGDRRGPAVVFMPTLTQSGGLTSGPLSVWSAAFGVQPLASAGVQGFDGVVRRGGRADEPVPVAYYDNTLGFHADLYVATTAGAARTKLASGVRFDDPCGTPQLRFAGATLLFSSCTGAGPFTISAFAGPTWSKVDLTTTARAGLAVDASQTNVLASATNGLSVFPVAGSANVLVDPRGYDGLFSPDGSSVIYLTSVNGGQRTLSRSPIATPAPITLATFAGADDDHARLAQLSGDGRWAVFQSANKWYLASTVAPAGAAPTPLPAGWSEPFTVDSRRLLFLAGDLSAILRGTAGGDMLSIVPGGPSIKLGAGATGAIPLTGAQVLLSANLIPGDATMEPPNRTVDLSLVDAAGAVPAQGLVAHADTHIALTEKGHVLIYSLREPLSMAGIWAMPLP